MFDWISGTAKAISDYKMLAGALAWATQNWALLLLLCIGLGVPVSLRALHKSRLPFNWGLGGVATLALLVFYLALLSVVALAMRKQGLI